MSSSYALFSKQKWCLYMIINYHPELSIGFAVPMHNILLCFMWKTVHSSFLFCFVFEWGSLALQYDVEHIPRTHIVQSIDLLLVHGYNFGEIEISAT